MHELLLFAQIPLQNHSHMLKILAGITAMQPLTLSEHHLIFKPTRLPSSVPTTNPAAIAAAAAATRGVKPAILATSSQSTDLFYVQLVEHLSLPAPTATTTVGNWKEGSVEVKEGNGKAKENQLDFSSHPWTLEFRDLPEVQGKNTATARLMSSVPVTAGDPVEFVEALGYKYITSYIQQGHQFTHNSTSIRLTQTIPLSPSASSSTAQPSPAPKELASLPRLDPLGTYLLQASIRVQDGSNPDTMRDSMKELQILRDMLKGIVELEFAERLTLDSRVR